MKKLTYLVSIIILGIFLMFLYQGCDKESNPVNGGNGTSTEIVSGKWIATAQNLGGFEFIVDDNKTYVTELTINAVDWICGGVTQNGSMIISSDPGWQIENRAFTINVYLAGGDQLTVTGTFGSTGKTVSGTWQATINNSNCNGNWTGAPE